MNRTRLGIFIAAFLLAGWAHAADKAPFQLKGILVTGQGVLFGLSDLSSGKNGWLALGSDFDGYTLARYDEAGGVLFLESEGKSFELKLATPGLAGGEDDDTPQATLDEAMTVIERLRMEEMVAKAMENQKKMAVEMAKQMASQIGDDVDPKDLEEYQTKVTRVLLEAMDVQKLKKEMAGIYAQTFSKDELSALEDFFSSTAGQAMVDKQPLIQEKIQAVIMPRILAASPKLQQIGDDFAQQQQTKRQKEAAATVLNQDSKKARASGLSSRDTERVQVGSTGGESGNHLRVQGWVGGDN